MKKIFFLIINLLLVMNLAGQAGQRRKTKLLNFMMNKNVNIYNSWGKEKIVANIKDDSITENYHWFDVISKKDSMINVIVLSTMNPNKQLEGWIGIINSGIYIRPHNATYVIYKKPNYKSEYIRIKLYGSYLVKVLDISHLWLKVEVRYKNKLYKYWLPYEYQCDDVFDSCT